MKTNTTKPAAKTAKAKVNAELEAGAKEIRDVLKGTFKNGKGKANGNGKGSVAASVAKTVEAMKPIKPIAADKPAAKKAAKAKKAAGGLKAIFGYAVTAVCRALGNAGMSPLDAIKAIHHFEPATSPATVRIQVNAGKNGQRGDPAPLSKKEMTELKKAAA
jgi:hypothetical protein